MAKDKARYFTFLLYPESIPMDWKRRLELIGVPIAISPLHDKDKSNVEGQIYRMTPKSKETRPINLLTNNIEFQFHRKTGKLFNKIVEKVERKCLNKQLTTKMDYIKNYLKLVRG
nr:Rep family protein [Weissella sagaensis]